MLIGGIVLGCTAVALAQDVARVEEDWELIVGVPDANSSSPQVAIVISPTADLNSRHSVFLVNHQTEPSFVAGGLQLQVRDGSVSRSQQRFPDGSCLRTDSEVVRWTQAMELVEGGLEFSVRGGTSTTWGEFGGQGYLKNTVATDLENLNGHSSDVSQENSGVVLAKHRVVSLRLVETRRYTEDGQLIEDASSE